jgi:hypothetical protein
MSDETDDRPGDSPHDLDSPDSTDAEHAQIRALLAELGSGPDGEPMPPEVSARLDDTLARLVAERSADQSEEGPGDPAEDGAAAEGTGTVVPLRRRWGSRVTAAAAAVIVLGAGGVAAANLGVFGGSGDSLSSSDAGGANAKSGARAEAPTPSTPSGASREAVEQAEALPRVSSTSFASDAARLVRESGAAIVAPSPAGGDAAGGTAEGDEDSSGEGAAARRPAAALSALSCPGPKVTDAAVPNPVVYDGSVAVLLVHPASASGQLVEAWSCEGNRRLASATITP